MQLQEITELALKLLGNAKRHDQLTAGGACKFDYVNLKEDVEEHQPLLVLIQQIAKKYQLSYKHARLSRYRPGDFCNNHIDSVPHAKWTCVLRLNYGEPKLRIHQDGVVFEPRENPGVVITFNPKSPHEVLPLLDGEERIVLNFWLIEGTDCEKST